MLDHASISRKIFFIIRHAGINLKSENIVSDFLNRCTENILTACICIQI